MKKNINYLLLLLFGMLITVGVKASTCSDSRVLELSSLANEVNVSYQEYDKVVDKLDSDTFGDEDGEVDVTYPAYYLTIYNLSDDLNASIVRSDTKETVEVSAKNKDKDGVVYVDAGMAAKVKLFTVKIRSNDSSCKNEVLKALAVTTPMFNDFSTYTVCQEYPEFELCKKYTTVDYSNLTMSDFNTKLEEYKVKKEEEERQQKSIVYNVGKFFDTYKWYIIGVVIIGVAIIVIYRIRRKKSRLV